MRCSGRASELSCSACWAVPRGCAVDSGHRTAPTRGSSGPSSAWCGSWWRAGFWPAVLRRVPDGERRHDMSKPPDVDRRRFVGVAAATVAAGPLGLFGFSRRVNAMTQALTDVAQPTGSDGTDIRPFRFKAADADLTDLRRRINATKWPERETVNDQSQGVRLSTMQNLARYWGTQYDWRKCEARLAALPQFTTTIDGVDTHFIHVRSKEKNALPVIVTHGWPGSIIEQLKIIDPLTNPTAYGGTAADAFDVVIPSLPGYGFSGKPTTLGWDPIRVARAWAVLMDRLGYKRYVAQGGDWGNAVTEQMALLQPAGLIGIHTNMPATVPPEDRKSTRLNSSHSQISYAVFCLKKKKSKVKSEPSHVYESK